MNKTAILVLTLLLGCTTAALAQDDDPCASDLTYGAYLERLSEQVSDRVNGKAATTAATDAAKAETKSQLASRANADGLTDSNLDLLHRAFVALGLGQVDEEEGQLVFNFNPELLDLDIGKFSPRVIVHDPVLFTALDKQIGTLPEAIRQSTKDSFEKELEELDDVEARLRWTNASSTPDAIIQELASDIFQPAYAAAGAKFQALGDRELSFRQQIGKALQEEAARIRKEASDKAEEEDVAETSQDSEEPPPPVVETMLVSEICKVPVAKKHFQDLDADVRARGTAGLTTLRDALTKARFFDLADLIEGEPRFTIEAAYRSRDDAAGPDERSASLRYEFGNISYRDFKDWAGKNSKAIKGEGASASVGEYLDTQKGRKALPKFSVSIDYSSSPELRIPLAAGMPDFVQPDASKITGMARGGWYFGDGRDRRIELEANYDDVSDDPARQDRFVGKLSWVEKLSGMAQAVAGSDLVVTLVYGSKPEFRGEVDEELGVRFGLKWSLGDPTK
jgi:hypothetical protein